MTDNRSDYTAVPPPPSLTTPSAPVNFNDALSKARAIAEKLKQAKPPTASAVPAAAPAPASYSATAGSKRGYRDDSYDEGRSDYYSRSSYGGRDRDYYDDRETKRGAYESRGGFGNDSRRYGLGSEERRSTSHHDAMSAGPVIQDELTVPNHMVGIIIGKGGDNLKKIERMSGAKVQFAGDTGDQERRVEITGEADQVKIARDMIQQTVDDTRASEASRYGGRPSMMDSQTTARSNPLNVMKVPSSKVGLIIGRGGETIRDLEERSGAKITVAPEPYGERSYERTINLVGDELALQRARALIDEIVNEDAHTAVTSSRDWSALRQQQQQQHYNAEASRGRGDDDRSHNDRPTYGHSGGSGDHYGPPPDRSYGGGGGGYRGRFNDERESVQVPKSAVGFIIGRGGETVRALQDQSGARIKVDPNGDPDSPERTINIFGNPDAVARAKQLIMDKVAEGNANRGSYGGRYGNSGHRGRGYGSGNYGNNDYGSHYNQGYSSQYQDGSGANSGYDYSQYQQYYAQYGYDQNQQGTGSSAGRGYEGYQYGGYPYSYEGYGQYGSSTTGQGKETDTATKTENAEGKADADASAGTKADSSSAASGDGKVDQNAAYYAQYYGGSADGSGDPSQQQQWTQEAYYQWYQQYYGGQYGSYDGQQQGQTTQQGTNNAEGSSGAEAPTTDDAPKQ